MIVWCPFKDCFDEVGYLCIKSCGAHREGVVLMNILFALKKRLCWILCLVEAFITGAVSSTVRIVGTIVLNL